jgi:hypothetical protein
LDTTIKALADRLMRAVVATGAVRKEDAELACAVMREELKEFLTGPRYADERELAKTGGDALAFASLVTACAARIVAERAA